VQNPSSSSSSDRGPRAHEWELTARASLLFAFGAGVLAAAGGWDLGDLLVGVYFAAVSLLLWVQGARIRHMRSPVAFNRITGAALVLAFAVGAALATADVASGGVI
jgi:hypothetical protein